MKKEPIITFELFKKIFNSITGEPEFRILFDNTIDEYMLIKYKDYVTFQKCGNDSKEIKYKSLDEINLLESNWNNIEDIMIDECFSIKEDLDDIVENYNIKK